MPVAPTTKGESLRSEPFERQATDVLRRLRATLSAVISAIPAVAPIRKAADLQRALEIPNTLAWQVYRLARAVDPIAEGGGVPGTAAMSRFFDAAAKRGAPAELLEAATASVRDFDAMVKTHAGTRSAFDSMIAALTDRGAEQADLVHRRAAFKANGHIWGVQAKVQLSFFAFQPSAHNEALIDMVSVRGLIGLRRLRRDAAWVVSRMRMANDDGTLRTPLGQRPLDPAGAVPAGVSLLREFCGDPLPTFRTVPTDSGFTNIELDPTRVGNTSAVTCLLGDVYEDALVRYRDEHNQTHSAQTLVRTPCEVLFHDLLVRADTFGPVQPRVLVYGDHRGVDPAMRGRECDLLGTRETVEYLGRGPDVLHTPEVPRYAEMVRYSLERAGWTPEGFDVYRCRVEYPVMPSSVVVLWDLPDPPAGAPV
jgi:hypothetical protein